MDYRIPEEVMLSDNLGRKEKLLFSVILTHSDNGKSRLTNKDFAELIGLKNPNQITKSLQKLKKENLVTVYYKKNVKKNVEYNVDRTIQINEMFLKRRRKRK